MSVSVSGFLRRLSEGNFSRWHIETAFECLDETVPFARAASLLLNSGIEIHKAIEFLAAVEADYALASSTPTPTFRRLHQREPRTKKYGPAQDPDRYMSEEKRRAYNFGYYLGVSDILSPRLPEREWLPLVGQVFRRDRFTCTYCGADGENYALHCDHIVPISRGGTNDLDNLTTACDYCNCSKRDLMPHEWRPLSGLPEMAE